MKPVRLSQHARTRAVQRGAREEEIIECVVDSPSSPAEGGRFLARKTFRFDDVSPINGRWYRFKTVEPIFAVGAEEILVVTVKVYYGNEEKIL